MAQMTDADYYKAKCALLEAQITQAKAEDTKTRAWQKATALLRELGVPEAQGYTWDDTALTITPTGAGT